MADTFEESLAEVVEEDVLEEGDECPEGHCDRELFERRHPRDSQIDGTPRHPDAPETEVVCLEDGVQATR